MDLQKEREAFEKAFAQTEFYRNKADLYSLLADIDEPFDFFRKNGFGDYSIGEAQAAWSAWQAAKAQAVPKWISVGDSLPPVDETVLVCWDYVPDIEPEKEYTTKDENLDEYWPNCQDEPPTHWMPLPKVVKAQEPAND